MAKPSSNSAVAGAGTGISPCAVRTVPPPIGSGATLQRAGPIASIAAAAAVMSAMESTAPTSWNATSSAATPCTRPSASARPPKMPMA